MVIRLVVVILLFSFGRPQALVGTNDLPEAIAVYEEALRLEPNSPRLKAELQKVKDDWKRERGRHMRALSRAFKLKGSNMTAEALRKQGNNKRSAIVERLRSIVSSYLIPHGHGRTGLNGQ